VGSVAEQGEPNERQFRRRALVAANETPVN
jgi:hypothetical protein